MPKYAFLNKHIFVYIVILLIGIEIGVWISAQNHSSSDSSTSSTPQTPSASTATNTAGSTSTSTACREPAAITTEPQDETLGRPQFIDPGVLKSSVQGWIHVRWRQVTGAKAYNVRVWNQAGVEVKNFMTYRTFSFLKNLEVDPRLKETPYSIIVTPLGENEAKGKASEKKLAAMQPLRNLEPPTIKSIQTQAEGDEVEETPATEIKK